MKGLKTSLVSSVLLIIIVIVIIFTVLGDTSSDIGNAAGNVSATRINASFELEGGDVYPLASFFKRKGIILLAVMAGIAIVVITAVLPKHSK